MVTNSFLPILSIFLLLTTGSNLRVVHGVFRYENYGDFRLQCAVLVLRKHPKSWGVRKLLQPHSLGLYITLADNQGEIRMTLLSPKVLLARSCCIVILTVRPYFGSIVVQ